MLFCILVTEYTLRSYRLLMYSTYFILLFFCVHFYYCFIIIKSFYSLWSIRHPWRASRHCGLQLSSWPHSMTFLCSLSYPLLSFATFSSAHLSLYPWGFQSNAVFSITPVSLRNVCPIQFNFLLFIWFSIDFWWVILHLLLFKLFKIHGCQFFNSKNTYALTDMKIPVLKPKAAFPCRFFKLWAM